MRFASILLALGRLPSVALLELSFDTEPSSGNLFDGRRPEGRQSFGSDATGVAPGVYFVRAEADGRALTVPMTVVK